MSLRYRLFLWVSSLFFVAAICSLFMESYVTHKELVRAQESLRVKIAGQGEIRRRDLQNFLASVIGQKLVVADELLNNVSLFKPQIERYGPTLENLAHGTWGQSSNLLLDFRWIDFLQNSNQGRSTATIIPKADALDAVYRIDIEEGISWMYLQDRPEPYLAIQMPFEFIHHLPLIPNEVVVQNVQGIVPSVYFFFDPLKMAGEASAEVRVPEKSAIPVSWTEGYSLELAPFVQAFQKAAAGLKGKSLSIPQLSPEAVIEKIRAEPLGIFNMIPKGSILSTVSTEKYMQGLLENTAMRFLQINMIWMLIQTYESGIFGNDLFSFPSPEGMSIFSTGENVGLGVRTGDVLYPHSIFEDSAYFAQNAPSNDKSSLASSLAVIGNANNGHVYLGNTTDFTVMVGSEKRKGFLTLGTDADEILQQLVMALHQKAFIVHDNQVLSLFDENGQKIPAAQGLGVPVAQIIDKNSGELQWNTDEFFFLHMKPFPSVDLHFFLLNPAEVEFALLRDLEEGSRQVVKTILFNIHMIGLLGLAVAIILLHNVARRITKPIIELARATKEVAYGNLEEIKIVLPPLKHDDEIAVLCHSFEEMVKGLAEKEKVKAVLNKVVSPEIAQEILNGKIHLGGEEKKVSVLFADIRDFTKISQHMPPHEVIDLLNTCMTKISALVDKNAGVIDKFVGDEAMALFGAPIPREDAAMKAVLSALGMLDELREWNLERQKAGQPLIEMGIGIHTGIMLAGNMGAENRLNYTVLGSNVNLASRLCAAAKKMELLITKDTLLEPFVKESVVCEALPPMEFKGIDRPIEVYRVTRLRD